MQKLESLPALHDAICIWRVVNGCSYVTRVGFQVLVVTQLASILLEVEHPPFRVAIAERLFLDQIS